MKNVVLALTDLMDSCRSDTSAHKSCWKEAVLNADRILQSVWKAYICDTTLLLSSSGKGFTKSEILDPGLDQFSTGVILPPGAI